VRLLVVAGLVASLLARPAAADDGERWDLTTVGVQLGGGVSGAVIGGVGLGLTGLAIGYAAAGRGNWGPPIVGGAMGLFAGAFAGMVIGVQLSGDGRDGTGHWWGTLGGAVVGTGGSIALVLATESTRGLVAQKAAGFILLSLGLTVVGYHVSADGSAPMAVPLTLRF
jgi:hypothetical protein